MTHTPTAGSDLERLRARIAGFSQEQAGAFHDGAPVSDLLAARAEAFDGWLRELWSRAGLEAAGAALFAVGGYGRGELYPQSDLDVLILIPETAPARQLAWIESFIANLWDLNLRPGHAVRTLAQCTQAAADLSVCTTLMEARLIAGDPQVQAELAAAVAPDRVWPVREFIDAKLVEAADRHARYGDTSYNLEPNLKEGPGGLRDIQTLGWIARRATGSTDPSAWSDAQIIGPRGQQQLVRSHEQLRRLRFALHLAAGRVEERLLFDYQPTLAEQFGYRDEHRENRAVEQMMQTFFRAALGVRRVYARVTERWREYNEDAPAPEPLGEGFLRRGKRLAVADGEVFIRDPASIVRLFACWQLNPELVALTTATSTALERALVELVRLVEVPAGDHATAMPVSTSGLAGSAGAREAFLRIMRGPRVAETLSRMHLYGVLGAYLPAFARVTGRMQYDLFHVYTVDQHTLNVIRNLDRLAVGQAEEFPGAVAVFESLRKPELLYLAALFHDIAKGRGGDHSELGAEDATAFCADHELSSADIGLVGWLVRRHLMLSIVAQKSDITDPDVINGFAVDVGDRERLDMLYLLTMADIAGTAPTLWNAWKARLIADLHTSARFALRRGLEHPIESDERVEECRRAALELLAEHGIDEDTAKSIWEDFPPPSFLRYRPGQIAWVTRNVASAEHDVLPMVVVRSEGERGAREIFVHSPDIDGLFATITSALDQLDLDVVEARVITSRKGLSLDTFRVLERNRRGPDPDRDREIARHLRHGLGQRPLRFGPVLRSPSRTQRHFHMSPQIEFTDIGNTGRTRMALVCSDRPGLLALVAQLLREHGVRVHGARIATFGERAEDFFTLSDEGNRPLTPDACEVLAMALCERLDRMYGNGVA